MNDLQCFAPHVKAAVVMPGHIGTSIGLNSRTVLGKPGAEDMAADELAEVRARLARQGIPTDGISDEQLKAFIQQRMLDFRDNAPTSAAEAATIILDGVRSGQWRILVGEDAQALDRLVREHAETAYELPFFGKLLEKGIFSALVGALSQTESPGGYLGPGFVPAAPTCAGPRASPRIRFPRRRRSLRLAVRRCLLPPAKSLDPAFDRRLVGHGPTSGFCRDQPMMRSTSHKWPGW